VRACGVSVDEPPPWRNALSAIAALLLESLEAQLSTRSVTLPKERSSGVGVGR